MTKKWNVGDDVLVQESMRRGRQGEAPIVSEGKVIKVGRVNVTVEWGGRYPQESVFRMDDGRENTPHARNYSQDVRLVFTPEGWAKHKARSEARGRIAAHRRRGALDYGGLNHASTTDLVRLADLLDEIAANSSPEAGL